jgi:microcystin degradation protein MlrC
MKVLAACIKHETNTFSVLDTTLASFEGELFSGADIVRTQKGARSEFGGFIDAAEKFGWELIPAVCAEASPSGFVDESVFDGFSDEILALIAKSEPVDGVLLALHGAMATRRWPDAEGELLRRVRDAVGDAVPVAVTLDLHANVTSEMIRHATLLSSYRTTPHVDQYETAMRVAGLLERTMRGEITPKLSIARQRMLAAMDLGRTIGGKGPMVDLLGDARRWQERHSEILDISVMPGFYYADIYEAGPSVVVVGNGEDPVCQRAADDLIERAWITREQQTIRFHSVAEAIELARKPANGPGPLLIADYTDGPGGGGYCDATNLLNALIDSEVPNVVFGAIADPRAAARGVSAGVGATLTLSVGGWTDHRFGGGPLMVHGVVEAVSDGRYLRKGPFMTGTYGHFGPSCVLRVGEVRIVVVSERVQTEDREQFRIFGIDPEDVNVLACKGINHFRADFESIGRGLIFVDAGGIVATDLRTLPYQKVRRPIWPLDQFFA